MSGSYSRSEQSDCWRLNVFSLVAVLEVAVLEEDEERDPIEEDKFEIVGTVFDVTEAEDAGDDLRSATNRCCDGGSNSLPLRRHSLTHPI